MTFQDCYLSSSLFLLLYLSPPIPNWSLLFLSFCLLNHFYSLLPSLLLPQLKLHPSNGLFLPYFCSYSRIWTQIWNLELGASEQRTCSICLLGSALSHSIWSLLVPPIYLQSSVFIFIYSWLVSHTVYGPHFLYSFISWRPFGLFPFPRYCEQSSNERSWASIWKVGCQVLWAYIKK